MNRRKASDAGGSVLSFTFLDVLMCTMGSLLLLLVLFGVIVKKSTRARREGEDVKLTLAALTAPDAPAQAAAPPAAVPPDTAAAEVAAVEKMSQQLAKLRGEQAEIERIRGEAAQRRLEEQDRIAHVEDHERRLEHELAQLHITLEVLEATEQKQTVDQEQADAEVARLKELISETETRLDKMRKADTGQKSYAIVPYKGANGTFRRPVFVECTADAVTIQPEGITLTVDDFDGPLRSGNPLAAAIRAAHEELNGRAVAAGRTDLPDPYPLLIVRPDGAAAYAAAIDAIRSWDSDYGYEFVEADWKLKYPELDPRLAQVMAHAVDEARQRQALLAKVAPRQYGSRLGGAGDGGGGGGDGFGELTSSGTGNRIGSHSGDGAFGGGRDARGNSLRTGGASGRYGMGSGSGEGGEGNFSDEFAAGDATAGGSAGGALTTTGGGGPGNGGAGGNGIGDPTAVGGTGGPGSTAVGQGAAGATGEGNARDATQGVNGQYAANASGQSGQAGSSGAGSGAAGAGTSAAGQAGGSAEGTAGGGASGGSSGGASGGTSSVASGSSGGGAGGTAGPSGNAGSAGGSPSVQVGPQGGSIADKRGANWANAEAARRTSAITRPVRVLVRAEQLAVIPEGGTEADAQVVSFKQPVERVVDQLAGAVQMQVVDWGLAGDGMYWRPTLVVTVAPGAERQAERLAHLLDNSGLDVRLPQSTANASQTERQ